LVFKKNHGYRRFMTFAPLWLQVTKAELFSVSVEDPLFVGKI
jgi:hypothetical protein